MMRELHVLNLGAGVQSTVAYMLSMDPASGLRFDAAIFADTQDEPGEVYRHLDWLRTLNGPPILTGTRGSLKENILKGMNAQGHRFVSIPCYTKAPLDEKEGMVRRQCTMEYKIEVVQRIIRRTLLGLAPRKHIPKDTTVVNYFGISIDEVGRRARIMERYKGIRGMRAEFPLVDLGWSRRGCQEWLKTRVPHEVQRSACKYCPLQNDYEWERKKKLRPADFEEACQVDDALRVPGMVANRGMDKPMFLHRSCIPLRMVDFENLPPQQLDGFTLYDCTGACGN